jgi:hypothetical protein
MALNYNSSEVRMGLFLSFCFALFVAMIFTFGLGRVSSFWRPRESLFVVFADAGAVTSDSPVRYNGIEIGRVKRIRIIHLEEDALDRLGPLSKRDLPNLPFHPATLVRELRNVADADFESRCRAQMLNRTMVELCLEVDKQNFKHFRQDDRARVIATMFGDTAVEIISGNGPLVPDPSKRLMLGSSGDFFSNLANSMGEVKEILTGVTDVVGVEERKSFNRAQERFGNIQGTLERVSNLAVQRSELTARQLDGMQSDTRSSLADMQKALDELQPNASKATDDIGAHFGNMRDKIQITKDTADKTRKELSADAGAIRDTVRTIVDRCKPDFEAMKINIRRIYEKMGGLSLKFDDMRTVAGQFFVQSEDDLVRAKSSVSNSLFNFKVIEVIANENKDLMISNKDAGEHEYNTAVNALRSLNAAVFRINEIRGHIEEAAEQARQADPKSRIIDEAEIVEDKLGLIRDGLDRVRQRALDKMLPLYERKKAAWE